MRSIADCNPPMTTDGRIIELNVWAVREGLRRAPAAILFEEFCNRLVAAGVPIWRGFVGMRTLHPQWGGYTYTWWRDRDAVDPARLERGGAYDQDLRDSPFSYLRDTAISQDLPLRLRRRLAGRQAQRDFPVLEHLAVAGATDYFAELIRVGMVTEAFPDSGIGFSFATDRPDGFGDDDLRLIEAVLPPVSLAIVSDAEHTISAGLLAAYLGSDAGRRVHAGVVERGSVESIRAVLWYADIRGFTPIADAAPGPVLVDMLDDTFEILAAALRPRGGEVLKFLGDGMLASFTFVDATRDETSGRALDAAGLTPTERGWANRLLWSISRSISARCFMVTSALSIASTLRSSGRRSTRSLGSRPCVSRWHAGFLSRPNSPPRFMTKLDSSLSAHTFSEECASPKRFLHYGSEGVVLGGFHHRYVKGRFFIAHKHLA
jgi:hypothetical protein